VRGLRVNFDSLNEAAELASLARAQHWTVGIRIHTHEEHDPEAPEFPTQFGATPDEALMLLSWMHRVRADFQTVHFHLRTNVASAELYERALAEVAHLCRAAGFAPRFVDCGGGFPPPHVFTREGERVDANFSLREMARVYERTLKLFPSVEEIWLENGRWLSARSGVLVVKILEVKERARMRYLICDGGRTTNALVSNWERHALVPLVPRGGFKMLTTVTGPTCMAFDQLARVPLPMSLKAGDLLLWLDAGAYHLPWETRFSRGLAAVLWHDGEKVSVVRQPESFAGWWGQWRCE
jgi:diaminopimelate decarboxylase